jgi:hypothetical protein
MAGKTDLNNLMKGAQRSQGIERPKPETKNTNVSMLKNTNAQDSDEPRLNVAIRKSLHKRLKVHASQNDRQIREVIEAAILEYLERQG